MPRILLAVLALACVCSPALAISLERAIPPYTAQLDWSVLWLGVVAAALALILFAIGSRFRENANVAGSCVLGGAMVGLFVAFPALAETVTVNGQPTVILPWGDQIAALAVALREPILTVLLPIVAGYVIQAIRKVYPWAALFLSQRRVEMMLEAAVGYGINAVQGAAKGKTLSVNVAVPVIAKGTQYVIDTAPAAVIKAAGGPDGIAARMFRKLELDDHDSEATVLAPAVAEIGGSPTPTAEELRDAERMSRG